MEQLLRTRVPKGKGLKIRRSPNLSLFKIIFLYPKFDISFSQMTRCALSARIVYFFYFVFYLYSLIFNLITLFLSLVSFSYFPTLQHYEILSSEIRGNCFDCCHKHWMNYFLLDEIVTTLRHQGRLF